VVQSGGIVYFIDTKTWNTQSMEIFDVTGIEFSCTGSYVFVSHCFGIDVFEIVGKMTLLELSMKAIQKVGGLQKGHEKYGWNISNVPESLSQRIKTSLFL